MSSDLPLAFIWTNHLCPCIRVLPIYMHESFSHCTQMQYYLVFTENKKKNEVNSHHWLHYVCRTEPRFLWFNFFRIVLIIIRFVSSEHWTNTVNWVNNNLWSIVGMRMFPLNTCTAHVIYSYCGIHPLPIGATHSEFNSIQFFIAWNWDWESTVGWLVGLPGWKCNMNALLVYMMWEH